MISSEKFLNFLLKKNIKYYAGVPDSCTNEFCNALSKKKISNIVTANEGVAVSLGIGYHLATKKLPCVYLQNSGLGNATDPLTNLSNKEVYGIPLVLMIGWRGAPGINDEAQHDIQGRILLKSLTSYGIKYLIIKKESDTKKISRLINFAKKKNQTVALIIKPKTFSTVKKKKLEKKVETIFRRDIIEFLLENIGKKTKIISSVGYNSRELHQISLKKNYKKGKNFLLVGAMGHTLSVSLSYSKFKNDQVICLDGDGSFIMHLGSFMLVNKISRKNFKYILIDNESHESIGGQKIDLGKVDFKKLSDAFGFKKYFLLNKKKDLKIKMRQFLKSKGPSFFHVKVKSGTLNNLIRPKNFQSIKKNFMRV